MGTRVVSTGGKIVNNRNVEMWKKLNRKTAHFGLPSMGQKCPVLKSSPTVRRHFRNETIFWVTKLPVYCWFFVCVLVCVMS